MISTEEFKRRREVDEVFLMACLRDKCRDRCGCEYECSKCITLIDIHEIEVHGVRRTYLTNVLDDMEVNT